MFINICFSFFLVAPALPGVSFEIWENIGGLTLDVLFKDPRYPNNPDRIQTLSSFDTPVNRADNYGARVITYYLVITLPYMHTSSSVVTVGDWEQLTQ